MAACRDHKYRTIEGDPATPDWCRMKAGAIEDMQEDLDFRRLGLFGKGRRELMAMAKRLPAEFRPRPLTTANAYQLRRAIVAADKKGVEAR
jgi:hypothetical protein